MTSFHHVHSAHCESGVTSNLLSHYGVPVSEAMTFGLGSGIFFVYMSFVKVMGLPLTSYRSYPGTIFKKTCKRLGLEFVYVKYRDPVRGAHALDELLEQGRAVGLRGNIYWLPYIPEQFRFQFNAHSFVVYGRNKATHSYLVSDPILEEKSECPDRALMRSRYSEGPLAPKGLIYFPKEAVQDADSLPWAKAIHAGVKETVHRMLYSPVPFAGVGAIHKLARHMRKWPTKFDLEKQKLYVANVVRMQEEIGTGGAGFRFLYAAFLQEAGQKIQAPSLGEAARAMTAVGNSWREFASLSAQFCKDRLAGSFSELPDRLDAIAENERAIYKSLRRDYL